MRPFTISIAPYAAAAANNIGLVQTPASGSSKQALLLNGALVVNGVAILDQPRQVLFTWAGADAARVVRVEGTGRKGNAKIECVRGANAGTSQTVGAFKTVTAIWIDGNTAGTVSVGTTTIVDSDWYPVDYIVNNFGASLVLEGHAGSATGNFTVQLTNDRFNRSGYPDKQYDNFVGFFELFYPPVKPFNHDTLAAVVPATADPLVGNVASPVTGIRLRSNLVFTTTTEKLHYAQNAHGMGS